MLENKCLAAINRRSGGRFVDVDDVLLALFSHADCRDRALWPQVFGQVRAAPPRDDARTFISRAIAGHVAKLPPEDEIPEMPPRFIPSRRGG